MLLTDVVTGGLTDCADESIDGPAAALELGAHARTCWRAPGAQLLGVDSGSGHGQLRAEDGDQPAYELRLNLQLSALLGDWTTVADLVAEARSVAARACAPTLAWIAD